jgi:hypothetical protein
MEEKGKICTAILDKRHIYIDENIYFYYDLILFLLIKHSDDYKWEKCIANARTIHHPLNMFKRAFGLWKKMFSVVFESLGKYDYETRISKEVHLFYVG